MGGIPGAVNVTRGMLEFWIDPASPYHKQFFASGNKFVFFCGGGREFATATAEVGDDGRVVEAGAEGKGGSTVRLISVPDFSAQPVIVLVNLRTLDCHTVRVQV